jgi:hypothetical protein
VASGISIEPIGSKETGPCACCGRHSRRVWGSASADGRILAVYYVHWTQGHVADQGAMIDLILGAWGEAASAGDRSLVALSFRLLQTGPAMMVIDASGRPAATRGLAGRALARSDVIGTALAPQVFAITDAVLAGDERVSEILGGWTVRI